MIHFSLFPKLYYWLSIYAVVLVSILAIKRSIIYPIGILLLSTYIITNCLFDLKTLLNFSNYHFALRYISHHDILIRYIFSIALRVLLIVLAIGLLNLNNTSRKLLIATSWLQIVTIYLKHPLSLFTTMYAHYQEVAVAHKIILHDSYMPYVFFFGFCLFDMIVLWSIIEYFQCSTIKKIYEKKGIV